MKIFLKHIFRNLKENKKRTFLIMISLMFVGIFISFIVSFSNLLFNLEDIMTAELNGMFDYTIANKDLTPISNKQLENIGDGYKKFGFLGGNGYLIVNNEEFLTTVSGADLSKSVDFGMFKPDDGKAFNLAIDEIVILEQMLKDLNLSIGDKVTFVSEIGTPYELTIKDTIKNDLVLSYTKGEFYSFVTNIDTYKKITGLDEEYTNYYLILDDKLSETEVSSFKKKCEEVGLEVEEFGGSVDVASMVAMMIPMIVLVILLLAVIVYFVNNSFVKIILNERIPIMGTFRSLGATRKKVEFILILEMAMYGLIAGIISSGIGFLLCRLIITELLVPMMSDVFAGYDFGFISKTIDNKAIQIILIGVICITVFQVLLSLREIIKSNKMSIKDCIFNKYDDLYKHDGRAIYFGVTALLICFITLLLHGKSNMFFSVVAIIVLFISITKLLPVLLKYLIKKVNFKNPIKKMAFENIANSKLQISSSIILCILLSIIIIIMSYAEQIKVNNLSYKNDYHFDSVLEVENATVEDINVISFMEGIESTAVLTDFEPAGTKYFANNEVDVIDYISTDNIKTLLKLVDKYKNVDKDLMLNLGDTDVIISKGYAEKYNLSVGDYFYINFVKEYDHFNTEFPIYVKVAGIHNSGITEVFINNNLMNEMLKYVDGISLKYLYIDAVDGYDVSKLNKNINKYLEDKFLTDRTKTLDEYIEYIDDDAESTYLGVIVVAVVASIIVLICISNNLKISFSQRKKEFATMYSVCMSRKQLKNMVSTEITTSYIISAILSVVYSILLIELVEILLEEKVAISISSIILVVVVMFVIIKFVSLSISKNIDKIDIVDAIKYE